MERVIFDADGRRIKSTDEKGAGGAYHKYEITLLNSVDGFDWCADIRFQKGPVKETGINGCHQEDLLAIVIDRLECFQAGEFACEENADALAHCRDALNCLNKRTAERQERGVEGTNQL